jgi:exonuclease VII small subunit
LSLRVDDVAARRAHNRALEERVATLEGAVLALQTAVAALQGGAANAAVKAEEGAAGADKKVHDARPLHSTRSSVGD